MPKVYIVIHITINEMLFLGIDPSWVELMLFVSDDKDVKLS